MCWHVHLCASPVVQILAALLAHIGLVWEWSRSDDPRLRISACGLIRGLILESDTATVETIQRSSLDWGVRRHCWTVYY